MALPRALGAAEPHFFLRALDVFQSNGTYDSFQNYFARIEEEAAVHDLPL